MDSEGGLCRSVLEARGKGSRFRSALALLPCTRTRGGGQSADLRRKSILRKSITAVFINRMLEGDDAIRDFARFDSRHLWCPFGRDAWMARADQGSTRYHNSGNNRDHDDSARRHWDAGSGE